MSKDEMKETTMPKFDPLYDPFEAIDKMLDSIDKIFKFEPGKKKSKEKKKSKKEDKMKNIANQEDEIKIDLDLYARDPEYRDAVDKYRKAKVHFAITNLATKSMNLIMNEMVTSAKK